MTFALLYALAARIMPLIPPSVGYALCSVFGAIAGPWLPAWHNIQRNLLIVMPDASAAERARAGRRVVISIAKNYFDLFRFPGLTHQQRAASVVFTGAEHVERALADGRGVLVVSAHTGNYSAVVPLAALRFDVEVLLIVEHLADPRVQDVVNSMRRTAQVNVVELGPAAGRAVLRALRNNQIVVLGADRALAEQQITVDFFGRPTPIPSGPAALALRFGAPVVPGHPMRRSDNRAWVHLDPPIQFDRSGDSRRDLHDAAQKIAYHMQAYILRDPSQWTIAQAMWDD